MDLKGKVAIVTGAAGDIGAQTARKFVSAGAKVVLTDIDGTGLEQLERELGQEKVMSAVMDVTEHEQINGLVEKTLNRFGQIDILVNAAGICEFISMQEITPERWERVLDINLKSVFFLSRSVMAIMLKQGSGKIINIASSAGENGGILAGAHYCVAKAGVINLTKSLAKVLAPGNIQVNVVSPGPVDTQMVQVLPEAKREEYVSQIPLQRMGSPEDIASAIMFLASPSSDYITGQVIRVNGGLLM